MGPCNNMEPYPEGGTKQILSALRTFGQDLLNIRALVAELHQTLRKGPDLKEWYSTSELAEAMGVSVYTVSVRWCNAQRIESEKDPITGKWRIPGHEFQRLVKGGSLQPTKENHLTRGQEKPRLGEH